MTRLFTLIDGKGSIADCKIDVTEVLQLFDQPANPLEVPWDYRLALKILLDQVRWLPSSGLSFHIWLSWTSISQHSLSEADTCQPPCEGPCWKSRQGQGQQGHGRGDSRIWWLWVPRHRIYCCGGAVLRVAQYKVFGKFTWIHHWKPLTVQNRQNNLWFQALEISLNSRPMVLTIAVWMLPRQCGWLRFRWPISCAMAIFCVISLVTFIHQSLPTPTSERDCPANLLWNWRG